ncbi:tail fiber assembly protein [Citrobacter braakii]|uniref:tail fiber assembly protein n=1 Tax=Enterobacterales TaxID=91347 RepID=UPI002282CA20|nr:tail fiber assembly protein [Citrobacter braakii]MCY9801762.1 tail fiber assembly protein [Citrobacter braakii]
MTVINYYFNHEHPLRPFTGSDYANTDSFSPTNALRVAPEFKAGFHPCERDGAWIMMPDYRGTKVYDTATAQQSEIKELGELPDGVTTIAPDVEFPKWNGKEWVTDKAEKKESDIDEAGAKKQYLVAEATATIAPLQDAVDLDMATGEEESALREWKIYRVLVNRVDTSLGAAVVWPTPPASPAR